jgi:hypothetical protein
MRRAAAAVSAHRTVILAIVTGAALFAIALWLLLRSDDEQRRPSTAAPSVKPADDFVDSVGVNVHLGYADTAYGRHDIVEKKLRELGVRYIRDGLSPGQPTVHRAWRALASHGIRVDLIAGDPLRRFGTGPLEDQLAIVKHELRGAVVSLEGPNEYDNQGDPKWVSTLRAYQQRLYQKVKSDPSLARIPVLGPTVVKPQSHAQLGDISRWLDYGNIHPYPGGLPPDRDSHMNQELDWAASNAGSKPIQATETGYHNALNSASSHPPTTERAAGIYMPRLYLDYFRRGIARTFSYELLDQQPDESRENDEANFGLLRSDFSEKPAFVAVKRLIALLRDPGPAFKPDPLDYSLEGAPSSLRQVLLEKRDGTFYLALWNEVSVWDPATRKPLRPNDGRVRLIFTEPAQRIEVYRPSRSERSLERRSSVRSLALPASADVVVVKITPSAIRRPPVAPAGARP